MTKKLLFFCMLLLSIQMHAQTDTTQGLTAPSSVSKDYEALAKYLCASASSEQLKANIIFNWVTYNITLDIKEDKDPNKKNPDIKNILKTQQATSYGYTVLYTKMCEAVGLNAVQIDGYARSRFYDNNEDLLIAHSSWCAVQLNNQWYLVNPCSGAGYITNTPGWFKRFMNKLTNNKEIEYSKKEVFQQEYDPSQFMIAPLEMRRNRLAADPIWQLTNTAMPFSVFKAGDSAVVAYNKVNNGIIKNSAQLLQYSKYTDDDQAVDRADRTHTYNPMNWLALYKKENIEAYNIIEPYFSGHISYNNSGELAFNNALKKYKIAGNYVDSQKSYLPSYYADLKKKNTDKNRLTNERIRNMRTNANAETSNFKRRASAAKNKIVYYKKEQENNKKLLQTVSKSSIKEIETIKYPKSEQDPMLVALVDSILAKENRIKTYTSHINALQTDMTNLIKQSDNHITDYIMHLQGCDTNLQYEAFIRRWLYDSYDDNVLYYIGIHDSTWNNKLTPSSNLYFDNYDTTITRFVAIEQLYKEQLRIFKSIMRDLEQYRRLNNTWKDFDATYNRIGTQYMTCLNNYNNDINDFINYYSIHINISDKLVDYYKDKNKILERMEKTEQKRKEIEDDYIQEIKTFDEKVLDRYAKTNKDIVDKINEYLDKNQ